MPAMPRPAKAEKISHKIMKKTGSVTSDKQEKRINGENKFEMQIRKTIKR
jgi:hypothetical protein